MTDFEFPVSLGEYKGEDQTKNKPSNQIYKYLSTVHETLIDEPEKLNECETWLDFVYYSIKSCNKTQQINRTLSDIIKNQLDKAYLGTLKLGSERIALFLGCCYLCWDNQLESLDHVKVLKGFVKYLKNTNLISECFSSIVSVATSNIKNLQSHQIVALLLQKYSDQYQDALVTAFSSYSFDCVPLLRRLNRQRIENEDEETQRRFQELLTTPCNQFIERVILQYLLDAKPLYAKTIRDVVLQMIKHLPEFFAKQNVLHALLKLYDKDYYLIRNTVTMALGELLCKSVLSEEVEDKILQLLLLRTHDSHVHGRSCTLYQLKALLSSRTLKLNHEIMQKAVERLKDKGSSTRKAALLLLDQVIQAYAKQYGIITFKPSQLEKNQKQLQAEKYKLIEDCQNLSEELGKGDIDIKYYLNNLELQLNQCREKEAKLKAQLLFQEQLKIAMTDLINIALSNIHTEIKGVLMVFSTLMINHQDGLIENIKKILVLVYEVELKEEFNKLIFDQFARSHYKMIKLLEICDLLEITCLEQLFKGFRQKNLHLKATEAWEDLKQGKHVLSNLRIIRFNGIMDDQQLYEKLCMLLKHLRQNKQFNEITEIIKIIEEVPNEDVHQIFIKEIIDCLCKYDGSDLEWFRACDCFIRFTVEKIPKPEITLQEFLNVIPIDNIPQLMFASSTIGLKLFVYGEKMIQQYRKEKDKPMDEIDQMDSSIHEHLDGKIKELQDLFERLGDMSEYSRSAESICQNMITDTYKERNLMIDQISVMSLLQFMIISRKCTMRNINTIMEILDCQQVQSIIKCNIITMLSDVYYKHPDLVDINKLLLKMDDKILKVRRTAIIIVSHLMLMELLRIDAAQIAKHINDPDPTIRKHAKIFFVELYKKDSQKFYQVLPDLITSMAHNYQVSEEDFKIFASEVIPLVQKDKLQEQILEKFLNRFDIFDREASLKHRNIMQRVQEGKEDIIAYNPVQLSAERELSQISFGKSQTFSKLFSFLQKEQFKQIFQKCRKTASSTQKNARKPEMVSLSQEYAQILSIFKKSLDASDPLIEKQLSQPQQPAAKPKKQSTQYRGEKKQTKQSIRIPDSDESSSMELEEGF